MKYAIEFNAEGNIVKESGDKELTGILEDINKMVLAEERK